MKYLLLFIILMPISSYCQSFKANISKNEGGRYYLEYIHNVYNRTEDVVSVIASDFLSKELRCKNVEHQKEDKTYSSRYYIHFKGYRNGCIKNADIDIRVTIYYKDNRTKIVFDDMRFINADAKCGTDGTMEFLLDTCSCEDSFLVGQFLKFNADKIASNYKDYIKKRQRDPKLF
ncbi:MAG: hypothetical protein JST70_16125 [Bacteroidetes bacterium]|nr:hypothetical protein [Bacteroidota bacterium]